MGYVDDIIIFSKTKEEHLQHLEEIFVRLRKFGLKMKREKCSFFKKHIQYLGHLVSERGFEPLPICIFNCFTADSTNHRFSIFLFCM